VPTPQRVPYALARLAVRGMGLLGALGGPAPAIDAALLEASALYTFVTSAKAQRELGYTIRPFDESARDTLRWFLRRGKLLPTTPELETLKAER
jgi:dihydroflavonol-4-reductase